MVLCNIIDKGNTNENLTKAVKDIVYPLQGKCTPTRAVYIISIHLIGQQIQDKNRLVLVKLIPTPRFPLPLANSWKSIEDILLNQ
jgi:hypothetical protein